LTRLKLH
jgi:hypothetical protein